MWGNLTGPSRLLAVCATTLLIASALLGVEAAIMIVLGPSRNLVLKPFILLGYLEACAMFFSTLGIVAAFIGLIFYRPYLYLSEKIYLHRASRSSQVSDKHTHVGELHPAPAAPIHNPEEDGAPD